MERFLTPSRYCEADAPAVVERAERLETKDARETAQNIYRFVRDSIQYNIRRKLRGAAHVLEQQDGMCFDKTNLFIALCRANDIPARYRELRCTLDVRDDDLPPDAFHLVPEIRLEGSWETHDPAFDDSVAPLVRPGAWDEPPWTSIQKERRYAAIPFYLPYVINHVIVPFSPKIRKIQRALDSLDR